MTLGHDLYQFKAPIIFNGYILYFFIFKKNPKDLLLS